MTFSGHFTSDVLGRVFAAVRILRSKHAVSLHTCQTMFPSRFGKLTPTSSPFVNNSICCTTAEHRQPERRGKLRHTSVAWQPWVSLFLLLSLRQHMPHPFSILSRACTRTRIWQPKAMVEPISSQRCIRTSLAACMLTLLRWLALCNGRCLRYCYSTYRHTLCRHCSACSIFHTEVTRKPPVHMRELCV